MTENKTAKKIEELKIELGELHNQKPCQPIQVDRLLDYWDMEDTLSGQINDLSRALDSGIDIVSLQEIRDNPGKSVSQIAADFGAGID